MCNKCIYRTKTIKTFYYTDFDNVMGRERTISDDFEVPACGKNPGNPVEINENRIACSECKTIES